MKKWIFSSFTIVLLLFSLSAEEHDEEHPTEYDVTIKTKDGHKLLCRYYHPKNPELNVDERAVILVHMTGGSRKDWNKLPEKLTAKGFNVLAIELRGHNKTLAKADSWHSYEAEEFNEMIEDIFAARKWVKTKRKVHVQKVAVVGAQMGANLCLNAMAKDKEILAAYCLSPGLNYRGVKVDPSLEDVKDRPLMFITSEEDTYGLPCLKTFKEKSEVKTEIIKKDEEDVKAIGTDLLKRKGVEEKIVAWLSKNF